jgi:hypothetical protein
MSYEPSHRKPPRQERWPNATPQEGWPAYPPGDHAVAGYRTQPGYPQAGAADAFAGPGYGYAWPGNSYPGAADGYRGTGDGFDGGTGHHPWNGDGYAGAGAGYDDALDGYGGGRDDLPGSADYLDLDEYIPPRSSGPLLIAPDTAGEPGWLSDPSEDSGREEDRYGLIVGAITGFLAAAVAIGVSTLAAAFVRPQASPIIAVGGAVIDRTPPAVKNFAVEHFGENDKTILLLGMYVILALIAIAIGCLARRGVTIGVAGIALFGLFGAFVAMTRPESHLTDVIPSVIGGIAGIAAFVWLDRAAAPTAPLRHTRGGSRWKPR